MPPLDAYKVDAFTDRPYGGNPAGVVPDAGGLADAQMQAVAREMNLSETAFVLPATRPDADLRLRYFTPTSEIPLCGHATVAAFHLLAELGRAARGGTLRVETRVGVLEVELRENGCVFLQSDKVAVRPSSVDPREVARLLGLDASDLADEPPAMMARDDLIVPVRGLKALERIRPDLEGIRGLAARGVNGLIALSFETRSPDALTHLRYFVPAFGIPEDPVTGVAHMELAAYLVHAGKLHTRCVFVGEQGDFCGRPGRVEVEVRGAPDALDVRVGGGAVTVLRGTMLVPPA